MRGRRYLTPGPRVTFWTCLWLSSFTFPWFPSVTRSLSAPSMDSHFPGSVSPLYPSLSSPQATTQRPSRSSSPIHPWPRWCWVIPGSLNTTLGWTGVVTPCRSGVEPAMPLVLCLLVFLCLVLCCRMRWGACLTCPRSIST